ncbi:uncharacterized protein stbd1 [Channa argus]|uniref:uncharacterized protein stbd1 n=1 Tax=Channa argus TaxID=215402 RepID=UPI003522626B
MSLKNSNTVALERRMDLASLFCMIGRHGPAVALTVVAVVSVLAAFIIYRTVRGKRRKAAAAESDSKSWGAERDASATPPGHEPITEESLSSVESTDVSDEGSTDTKEADDVILSHPKIRLRRVAADENTPPACSPSKIDTQVPDCMHATSDDTQVFKTDNQENESVTRDQDVSEEENLQCGSNNLMNIVESNLAKPVNHSGDVAASFICYGKDKKFEEQNHPDSINYSDSSGNYQFCPEEEKNKDVDNVTSTSDENIDGDDDCCLAVKVTSEILDKYHKCARAKFDNNPPPFVKQEVEAKAQISGVVNLLDIKHPQSTVEEEEINPPLAKDIDLNILHLDLVSVKKEIQHEKTDTGPTVVLPEKSIDSKRQRTQVQQTDKKVSNETFDKSSVPDNEMTSITAAPKADENVTASVMTEDSFLIRPSICQNQQSEHMEKALVEKGVHSTDAAECDKPAITPTIMPKKISHPDMPFSFQDQQSDQIQNNDTFSEVTISAAPVLTANVRSHLCEVNLSFEQSELKGSDKDSRSSPGGGKESGISSMTVSPDLQYSCNEFNIPGNKMAFPVMDYETQPEETTETQSCLFADDVALSVGTEGLAIGPHPSRLSQTPHSELIDSAANEDMFGHELEESYHIAFDQFMAKIAESVMSFTNELKEKTVIRSDVEVKESKNGATAEKKVEAEAEKENDDSEKTEISIMEATMDNNEWIMDSNYQVHPWIPVSVPSYAQNSRQTGQPHSEQRQHSSSLADATFIDAETTLSTEVKQTNHLVDDNTENSKKVLAVQPMPQNVSVTFRIHYLTHSPHQMVAVTGNLQELGNWKEFIPLERAKDGHWATVISLPAESHVEWKFVVLDKGQVCRWEECGNRLLDTGNGDDLIVHKWWGFL